VEVRKMMKRTLVTRDVSIAAEFIRNGQLVAFPTETVFGIGADALNKAAVEAIFRAKGRPQDNPVIVHIADFEDLSRITNHVSDTTNSLMRAFFPGPCTLVVPKREAIPNVVTAGLPTVGVRMPDHDVARSLIRESGCLIAAPSANISGSPSPTSWKAVRDDLEGKVDCILMGERTAVGLESTVVDCTVSPPVVLRPGGVTLEDLNQVVPGIQATGEYSGPGPEIPRAPGVRHSHYKPLAKVRLVSPRDELFTLTGGSLSFGYIGLSIPSESPLCKAICLCNTVEDYAHNLFDFFRTCDRSGVHVVYCERVPEKGIGVAIMDRLNRAAEQ